MMGLVPLEEETRELPMRGRRRRPGENPSQGTKSADTMILDLTASRKEILLFKPPSVFLFLSVMGEYYRPDSLTNLCDSVESECTVVKSRKRFNSEERKELEATCYQVQVSVKICRETISSDCVSSNAAGGASVSHLVLGLCLLFPLHTKSGPQTQGSLNFYEFEC